MASSAPVLDHNQHERMIPEISSVDIFWEHAYRYAFASRYVAGKSVLDVACGEGYGAAAQLRAGARQVIGVDRSEEACAHARRKYGIEARVGSAEKLPLADGCVEVVVSFETIEHLPNPLKFLDECVRVLTGKGLLIVSTPNKGVYGWEGGGTNPHHCSEMTPEEFTQALRERFRSVEFYTQRPYTAHWWSLRAQAAERPPWWRNRLVRRLRHAVRVRVAPKLFVNAPPAVRNSVVETIGQISSEGHSFLNPFVVRPRRERTGEVPIYLIAVARR